MASISSNRRHICATIIHVINWLIMMAWGMARILKMMRQHAYNYLISSFSLKNALYLNQVAYCFDRQLMQTAEIIYIADPLKSSRYIYQSLPPRQEMLANTTWAISGLIWRYWYGFDINLWPVTSTINSWYRYIEEANIDNERWFIIVMTMRADNYFHITRRARNIR